VSSDAEYGDRLDLIRILGLQLAQAALEVLLGFLLTATAAGFSPVAESSKRPQYSIWNPSSAKPWQATGPLSRFGASFSPSGAVRGNVPR
jgi:hypothetical protein